MNFSGISNRSLAGKALRLPLRLLPPTLVLPILQGKLRGRKWMTGSSNHGCWLGSYEYRERKAFEACVRAGRVVFDVGANVGYYTLLASVLVGPQGRVFAFEPVPSNLRLLKAHLRLNRTENVEVVKAAVAEHAGYGHFASGNNLSTGHLAAHGGFAVRIVWLDDLVRRGELPPPDYMKIDVEGAELEVLRGSESILTDHHPVLFLATHSRQLRAECCAFLRHAGYTLESLSKVGLEQANEVRAFVSRPAEVSSVGLPSNHQYSSATPARGAT